MPKWYDIQAREREGDDDHDATVMIYDVIGDYGVSASRFASELMSSGSRKPYVRINSPGGSLHDGMAITSVLSNLDATIHVDGIAASMASVILQGGKRRTIAQGAHIMVHSPWTITLGNANELREEADTLDLLGRSMVKIYARASGREEEEVAQWMAGETWFDADSALEAGLVDAITDDIVARGSIRPEALAKFSRVPKALREQTKTPNKSFMAFFSKKPDQAPFAVRVLEALGLTKDELAQAEQDGDADFLDARFQSATREQVQAAVLAATKPIKAELDKQTRAAGVYARALTFANLGLDLDKLPDNDEQLEATVKGALKTVASRQLADITAKAGMEDPVDGDGSGGQTPKPKPGEGLKGQAKLAAVWNAQLSKKA
jgi:ATP-dependent Clp protease, protease subunit